jgi:hypothetical protein
VSIAGPIAAAADRLADGQLDHPLDPGTLAARLDTGIPAGSRPRTVPRQASCAGTPAPTSTRTVQTIADGNGRYHADAVVGACLAAVTVAAICKLVAVPALLLVIAALAVSRYPGRAGPPTIPSAPLALPDAGRTV